MGGVGGLFAQCHRCGTVRQTLAVRSVAFVDDGKALRPQGWVNSHNSPQHLASISTASAKEIHSSAGWPRVSSSNNG